tara:strand:- start:639 stop:1034 length:396 start_codon:yes stop_codon:yes gene_type:complete
MDKNQTNIVNLLNAENISLPIIQSVSSKGIKIDNKNYNNNIIIDQKGVKPWELINQNISPDDFKYLLARDSIPELIIIGVGDLLDNPYYELREYFSNQKIPFDIMTTRSACRTWNFLIAERNNICVHLILD